MHNMRQLVCKTKLSHSSLQCPLIGQKLSSQTSCTKCLTLDNLNPCLMKMKFAIKGPIDIRAGEIEKELKEGKKKPFDRVIRANVGDAHLFGLDPITFIRQVLALVTYPELLNSDKFPQDAKDRARMILGGCKGSSIGTYTDPSGIEIIRKHCAEFIENRDCHPADWQDIFLSDGITSAIKSVLKLLIREGDGKKPGILVHIPLFPLYSANFTEYEIFQIGYYLDESKAWSLNIADAERALKESRKECDPRVIIIINPGNPTAQVLERKNIEDIIKFAHKEKLFILADEVYQYNIHDEKSEFHSFKKVLMDMGPPYNEMELASFMSCSKGYMGECGLRGGYCEIINMDPEVKQSLIKIISAMPCPNVPGQVAMDCAINPLKPTDPSYELFTKEKNALMNSLKVKAKMVEEAFNSFEGMSCNVLQGAMYAFPQIKLPPKAIEKAKSLNQCPSTFYVFQLLERTGVCVVAGSGFGQVEGTYHFRTTILPKMEDLKYMLDNFKKFHEQFVAEYK